MINRSDIARELRSLGLTTGDIVLLHSSLASLGQVEGGADAVVDAFLDVLGSDGTLVVPTFGAGLGVITHVVKSRPGAVSSVHPLASVAAIGRDAAELCRDHWRAELAHGEDTPYTRIADKDGYVCLLGVDQDRNTTLHTVEELLRLPYLKETSQITFETPEGPVTKSWPFFPGPHRDFIAVDAALTASGKMKVGRIGNAAVRLIRSRTLIGIAMDMGRKDPAFVLCDNPNCADCVKQRAKLRRAALASESFVVAAGSGLAGHYAEEMADNCHAAGIDAIELDSLRGRPLSMASLAQVDKAITTLRDGNIRVVALRSWSTPQKAEPILSLAAANGVARVVLPLSHLSALQAQVAAEHAIGISFFNAGMDSDTCTAILLDLKAQGIAASLTFNASNFSRAGELPFLQSYKKKLRRFVDQLDVEDTTYGGDQQRLAEGNAEIKEMISILRCAGFSGTICLTSSNRAVGSLPDAAKRLEQLIKSM